MGYKLYMPLMSLLGENCLEDAGNEIEKLGFKKALIVTDKILRELIASKVTKILDSKNVSYVFYDEVQANPTVKNVNDGVKVLTDNECDFIISLGGGSSHDCAKSISLIATNGGEIKDYEGMDKVKKNPLPLISINTTAGTASEMTLFAVITDTEKHIKMAIADKKLTPIIAVNDPKLMVKMPKGLTAATGMDALTHSIEAYVSTIANPITDACAEKSIKLITKYLLKAVENGNDMEARDMMAYAEYLAGMAFNNASVGYVHSIAHQLGGYYNLPHGVCNALLLPYVQVYNSQNLITAKRLKEVAKFMGGNINGITNEEGAKLCIELIKKLSKSVGIPSNLRELNVKEDDFETLATNALKDICSLTNPVQGSKEDIIAILKSAM